MKLRLPQTPSYALNRLLFDLRHDAALRRQIVANPEEVADLYRLDVAGREALKHLVFELGAKTLRDIARELIDAGAHELQALMTVHVMTDSETGPRGAC